MIEPCLKTDSLVPAPIDMAMRLHYRALAMPAWFDRVDGTVG